MEMNTIMYTTTTRISYSSTRRIFVDFITTAKLMNEPSIDEQLTSGQTPTNTGEPRAKEPFTDHLVSLIKSFIRCDETDDGVHFNPNVGRRGEWF